jgi:sugar (pentulose or hexulose) kinase
LSTKQGVSQEIIDGRTSLGIELGSTRIKAVLIDGAHTPVASGEQTWENRLEDGVWTYHLDDVRAGLQDCFQKLSADVKARYGVPLETTGAIGISAMMHGYLAFDKNDKLLVPFRTWRNTTTEEAASKLTEKFKFNIPQRWSVAHLYQAMLNNEPHVGKIAFLTTLAGYVHWRLTGKKVLGIGDASGMFPIDSAINDYDRAMLAAFDGLASSLNFNHEPHKKHEQFNKSGFSGGFSWKLENILPSVLCAGEAAGTLTAEGAKLLDQTGGLAAGIPLCPPEGDAGTGMAATNSVMERTGNVSSGTSIFAMVVLEKPLSRLYTEIDMVTTPAGKPVAMVHCNNCTSDLDAWVRLFAEANALAGAKTGKSALYDALYNKALEADPDCGGLLSYNYYGGEPVTGLAEGRPLFARLPDSRFTLANFMRNLLFSSMASLRLGMDILTEKEAVRLDTLLGHGGLFKTKGVGQRLAAAALNTPVAVMASAGEGGAWGIALLAAYMLEKLGAGAGADMPTADADVPARTGGVKLEDYLAKKVFAGKAGERVLPDPKDAEGFALFMARYKKGLAIERAAVEAI